MDSDTTIDNNQHIIRIQIFVKQQKKQKIESANNDRVNRYAFLCIIHKQCTYHTQKIHLTLIDIDIDIGNTHTYTHCQNIDITYILTCAKNR